MKIREYLKNLVQEKTMLNPEVKCIYQTTRESLVHTQIDTSLLPNDARILCIQILFNVLFLKYNLFECSYVRLEEDRNRET